MVKPLKMASKSRNMWGPINIGLFILNLFALDGFSFLDSENYVKLLILKINYWSG
jgi:hypothetical protein